MNNSMNDLMNLISVLCGGYCLYLVPAGAGKAAV